MDKNMSGNIYRVHMKSLIFSVMGCSNTLSVSSQNNI